MQGYKPYVIDNGDGVRAIVMELPSGSFGVTVEVQGARDSYSGPNFISRDEAIAHAVARIEVHESVIYSQESIQ